MEKNELAAWSLFGASTMCIATTAYIGIGVGAATLVAGVALAISAGIMSGRVI